MAIGKLRNHSTPGVATLAKEIVKLWKEAIDSKKKRKRDDGEKDDGIKRVKGEGSSSAASPAAPSPDRKPNNGAKPEASGSTSPRRRPPLSTIDSSRKDPRSAKTDGVDKTLRADVADEEEEVRHKCVVMIYDALAGDSTAGK